MNKPMMRFDDGSYIVWEDRESVRYIEDDMEALVWVDYESGFFSRGRIIRSSSIGKWEKHPANIPSDIDEGKKDEIISKLMRCYKKCRVET